MLLSIIQASHYALDLFQHATHVTVHSVYQKAINLKTDSALLTLQPVGSVLSPISLITSCDRSAFSKLPVTSGQELSFLPDFRHTSVTDLSLPFFSLAQAELRDLCTIVGHAIALSASPELPANVRGIELIFNQPELVSESLSMSAIRSNLSELLRSSSVQKNVDILCRLIGLGIGLTPSGDDFLCGFLAGLRLCHSAFDDAAIMQTALSQTILSHTDRTNDISAAFLKSAAAGQFSRPVHLLREAFLTPEAIYQAFSGIGHSSGIDTLCGIYTALLLFIPVRMILF